jgi:hypothetical protein
MKQRWYLIVLLAAVVLALGACRSDEQPEPTPTRAATAAPAALPTAAPGSQGYLAPPGLASPTSRAGGADYPAPPSGPEGLVPEPPDPPREMPEAAAGLGAVGGVLIQEVVGQGFIPMDPFELVLAEVVVDSEGNPTLIGFDDAAPRAETFPTGVFLFTDVPPGTYGLVVNLAVTQYAIKNPDGTTMLVTVEPGQVIDLGQVITQGP